MFNSQMIVQNNPKLASRKKMIEALIGGAANMPTRNVGEGIAKAGQAITGALLQKRFENDVEAKSIGANTSLQQALAAARGFTNPDTGEKVMPGGGLEAFIGALSRNPDTAAQAADIQIKMMMAEPELEIKRLQMENEAAYRNAILGMQGQQLRRQEQNDQANIDRWNRQLDIQQQRVNRMGNGGSYVDPDTGEIVQTGNSKPLPKGVLEMQQNLVDELASTKNIQSELGRFGEMLKTGKLDLGAVSNVWNKARNYAGQSTPESRNLQSFEAGLEKLRNDSLRLNKGVQTEGDATRAWNELVANLNDPGVVQQRLAEIITLNSRAEQIKRFQIDQLRKEYGKPEMDYAVIDQVYNSPVPSAAGATMPPMDDSGSWGGEPPPTLPQPTSAPQAIRPPKEAIDMLMSNPQALKSFFDEEYGPGAADRVLGALNGR